MYKVFILKSVKKDTKNLPRREKEQSIEILRSLSQNPRPHNCTKLVGSTDSYRIRMGNYRILYTLDDKSKEVIVYKIDHRKDVYK